MALSKKDKDSVKKAAKAGGLSSTQGSLAAKGISSPTKSAVLGASTDLDSIPAARGNEFAENYTGQVDFSDQGTGNPTREAGESSEDYSYRLRGSPFKLAGGENYSAFSNSDILDNKITLLDSQVQGLPSYGSVNTDTEDAVVGDEFGVDELLGVDGDKKKKKPLKMWDTDGNDVSYKYGHEDQRADPETTQMLDLIRQMGRSSDQASQASIASIKSRYDALQADQEAANASELAGVKQALNLGGSSRYAPLSSAGLVTTQISAGTRTLANLASQEEQLIAQAREAQSANDYELLEKKMGILENVRKEKTKAAEDLNTSIEDAQYRSSRDNAISGLVAQGVTDPAQMLDYLNFDDQGNPTGDFTLEEVSDALGYIKPKASESGSFKLETKQVGPLLASGLSMVDIQAMQDDLNSGATIQDVLAGLPPESHQAVMKALGAETSSIGNVTPGVGANGDPLKEQMIRSNLEPKVMSIVNKGTVSDADRAYVNENISYFRDQGLSPQQVLDIFSGWSADVSTPFNNEFRNIVLANQAEGQGVSNDLSSLGSLLASGDYKKAMTKVESNAFESKKGQEGYIGPIMAESLTKKVDRIKQILKQGGVWNGTGPIEGSFSNLLGRFKGNRAQELKSELTSLYADFRKSNAGTATTDSEIKFLEPLLADITDKEGNFVTKLDAFQRSILDGHNATRRSAALPDVQVKDLLDPNERLYLYVDQVSSDKSNTLDI